MASLAAFISLTKKKHLLRRSIDSHGKDASQLVTLAELDRLLMSVAADPGGAGLVASLEESGEAIHKLALADWMDEFGMCYLAEALRWAAKFHRHPLPTPRLMFWYWERAPWFWERVPRNDSKDRALFDLLPRPVLPGLIFDHLPTRSLGAGGYKMGTFILRGRRGIGRRGMHRTSLVLGSFLALAESLAFLKDVNRLVNGDFHDETP